MSERQMVPEEVKPGERIVVNILPWIPGKVVGPNGEEGLMFRSNFMEGAFVRETAESVQLRPAEGGVLSLPKKDVARIHLPSPLAPPPR